MARDGSGSETAASAAVVHGRWNSNGTLDIRGRQQDYEIPGRLQRNRYRFGPFSLQRRQHDTGRTLDGSTYGHVSWETTDVTNRGQRINLGWAPRSYRPDSGAVSEDCSVPGRGCFKDAGSAPGNPSGSGLFAPDGRDRHRARCGKRISGNVAHLVPLPKLCDASPLLNAVA